MFKTCLENRIIHQHNSYKCFLCNYKIQKNQITLALQHVELQEHKEKLDDVKNEVRIKETDLLLTISETQRRKLVDNSITFCKTFDYFRCHFCKKSYHGLSNTFEHIKSSIHIEQIKKKTDIKTDKKTFPTQKVAGNNDNTKQLFSENNKNFNNIKKEIDEQTINKRKPNVSTDEAFSYIESLEYPWFKCNICKCKISGEPNIREHAKGRSHLTLIELQKNIKPVKINAIENKKPTMKLELQEPKDVKPTKIKAIKNKKSTMKLELQEAKDIKPAKINAIENKKPTMKLELQKPKDIKTTKIKAIKNKKSSMKLELQKPNDIKPAKVNAIENKNPTMKLRLQEAKDEKPIAVNTIENQKSTVKPFIIKILYCTSCHVFLKSHKIIQFHAKLHLYKEYPIPSIIDIIKFRISRSGKTFIRCILCNSSIPNEEELEKHLNLPHHVANFNKFENTGEIVMLENSDSVVTDQEQLTKSKSIAIDQEQLTNFETDHSQRYLDAILCTVCDASIVKNNSDEHINGNKHLTKVQALGIKNKSDISLSDENRIVTYDCFLCNKNYNDFIKLFCHYSTQEHQGRLKYFKMFTKDKKMIKCNEDVSTPVKKNPYVKSDLHLRYNKDLQIVGPKYLSLCIESGKDNIYNIDREKLHLMQFGLSIMFLSKDESYCFACDFKVPYDDQYIYDHLTDEIHLENLNELLEDHYKTENEFTYFDLAKELMTEISDEKIKCFVCNKIIENYEDKIKTHKNLESHISNRCAASKETELVQKKFSKLCSDIWDHIDKYRCKVCKLSFTKELKFARHLSDLKHSEIVESLLTAEENRVENKINFCHSCSTCWFGEADFIKHQKDPDHINFQNKTIMFPKMRDSLFILLNSIDNVVENLICESDAVAEENVEEKMLQSIEETVKAVYPNAKAYAFGSRSSYLGLKSSDVDIFLDCENNYNSIGSKKKGQNYIRQLTKYFFNLRNENWKGDCVLLNPRVPIMKLLHRDTGIFCDTSFISGLGVEKSKLIKKHVAYKHCREMMLYLKKWLNAADLHGAQAINTYAISWFVIFYLQIEGIFPSVYSLIKMNEQSNIVDGWECGFPEKVPISCMKTANKTLKDLLKGFFTYYTTFNFQTSVVCPYLGIEIDKSQFAKNDLPNMNNYCNRLKTEDLELFRFDSPMCIQDPIDHTQNITKAVTKYQLRCFRCYCFESSEKLTTFNNSTFQ